MNTFQLQLFLTLSQTLNFTKTAEQLYISQPSVSYYVKSLEDNLGTKLINRDSRNVTLTPEGKEFVNYASQMLETQLEAENRIRNIASGRLGCVRIAILPSTAEIFSEILSGYCQSQPGLQVNIDVIEGADMMKTIRLCSHDLYFTNRYMIPENNSYKYVEITTNQLDMYMHRNSMKKVDLNDWSTLNGVNFISLPKTDFSLSNQIKGVCLQRGYTPEVVNYYRTVDALLVAVNAGIGLTILPSTLKRFYNLPDVVTKSIEGKDAVISTIIAWQSRNSNPDITSFVRYISDNGAYNRCS